MQWNLQSNACDVLSLGPRTAGRLATVGITTVAELIAAKAPVVAERLDARSIVAETFAGWQREAQLIVGLPELPPTAARLLAAVGLATAEHIRHSTPTELLAALETGQQKNSTGWLAQTTLPSVTEVSRWIRIAAEPQNSYAA